jgi:hypothetical protein
MHLVLCAGPQLLDAMDYETFKKRLFKEKSFKTILEKVALARTRFPNR